MATKAATKEKPAKAEKEATPRGKYDWAKWTDGNEHTLVEGKDFTIAPNVMQGTILRKASDLRRVTTTTVVKTEGKPTKVVFQFTDEAMPEKRTREEVAAQAAEHKAEQARIKAERAEAKIQRDAERAAAKEAKAKERAEAKAAKEAAKEAKPKAEPKKPANAASPKAAKNAAKSTAKK